MLWGAGVCAIFVLRLASIERARFLRGVVVFRAHSEQTERFGIILDRNYFKVKAAYRLGNRCKNCGHARP